MAHIPPIPALIGRSWATGVIGTSSEMERLCWVFQGVVRQDVVRGVEDIGVRRVWGSFAYHK